MLFESMKICRGAATEVRFRITGMILSAVMSALPCDAGVEEVSGQALQKGMQPENSWFKPQMTLTGEAWRNVDGGVETGSAWNYLVDLSAEVDLHQACGFVEGTSLALQVLGVSNRSGESLADQVAAFNPASGIMAGNAIRFYNLHFRQAWDDDRVVMKLGQMAADDDFMGSDFSGLFMNSSFGAMPSQVGSPLASGHYDSGAFPVFAVASPGAFVSYAPNERFFAQAAAYVGAPGTDRSSNHGFDWETGDDAGLAMFYEGGWHHRLAGCSGTVKLGGTLHSGLFDDYTAQVGGDPEASERGIHSFYVIWDQSLVENSDGDPLLGVFCRCGWSPLDDRSAVTHYEDLGVVWNGPFKRGDDAVGLALACTHFASDYRGLAGCANCEATVEMMYRAQITDWFAVQGALQWVTDPATSASSGGDNHALLAGLRTEFSF